VGNDRDIAAFGGIAFAQHRDSPIDTEHFGHLRLERLVAALQVVAHLVQRRLMREHDLQPTRHHHRQRPHRPIFPELAKGVVTDRPNQLWVGDLTYVAIPGAFVYLTAILDAWSRKVVGYAISRSMDARIAVATLKAAIRNRAPAKGYIHHSDRGSQYASEVYRELLGCVDGIPGMHF
jgi:putative transposase